MNKNLFRSITPEEIRTYTENGVVGSINRTGEHEVKQRVSKKGEFLG